MRPVESGEDDGKDVVVGEETPFENWIEGEDNKDEDEDEDDDVERGELPEPSPFRDWEREDVCEDEDEDKAGSNAKDVDEEFKEEEEVVIVAAAVVADDDDAAAVAVDAFPDGALLKCGLGQSSRVMPLTSATIESERRLVHGKCTVSSLMKPLLMWTGRLRDCNSSVLSSMLFMLTCPCQSEILRSSGLKSLTYLSA